VMTERATCWPGSFRSSSGCNCNRVSGSPRHPYLRLPLQFSVSLERPLLQTVSADELVSLRRRSGVGRPGKVGMTFTLIQSWGKIEGGS
jgi:hypothetical protein